MIDFWLSSLHTYGNVLFNTSYYVENGALLHNVMLDGKWSLEVMEKSRKIFMKKVCEHEMKTSWNGVKEDMSIFGLYQ